MRSLAWVVLAVGCAGVPDSDIDEDGIADEADDCIAGFADDAIDADGDGKDATQDLCPHDSKAAAGDVDQDGIPEACDPFPVEATRPDTRRCVTSFGVRWMNASYLVGRAGESEWNLAPPLRADAIDSVSIFSSFEKQYRSTTYEVLANVAVPDGGSFLMFVRADPDQLSAKDVACGVDKQELFVWANGDKHMLVTLPGALDGSAIRLRATVNPAAVLCRVTIGAQSIATTYAIAAPRGLFGFGSQGADVTIQSLVVDSNDSAPAI
jgi:hypothetical protein